MSSLGQPVSVQIYQDYEMSNLIVDDDAVFRGTITAEGAIISPFIIPAISNIAALRATVTSTINVPSYTISGYYTPGDGGEGTFIYVPTDHTSPDNGGTIIVNASGQRFYRNVPPGYGTVKQFGAKGDGVTNDSAAIVATIANSTNIVFPAGNYLYTTIFSLTPYGFGANNAGFIIYEKSNFSITAERGVSITTGLGAHYSNHFFIFKCHDFTISGLTNIGNTTTLTAPFEVCGYILMSCWNFSFFNITFAGEWLDASAMFAGDWLINGLFLNIQTDFGAGTGIGFDFAFMQNCSFINCNGYGRPYTLNRPTKFFSNIYDITNAGNNFTPFTYANTNNVTLVGCSASGYSTGVNITSGNGINIIGCNFSNNLVDGVFLGYVIGESEGFPVKNITFTGCTLFNNTTYGFVVDASNIVNSDIINNINLVNCTVYNNGTGVEVRGPTHVSNVKFSDLQLGGTLQTVNYGPNYLASNLNNTILGVNAASNLVGQYNIIAGSNAGTYVNGSSNIIFGQNAMSAVGNISSNQIAIGSGALAALTTGTGNLAIGPSSLSILTVGDNNTMCGFLAGPYITGSNNTGFGNGVLSAMNNTAIRNTAFGSGCMIAITSGGSNSGFGVSALASCTVGAQNAAFGTSAGQFITGSNNTCVGFGCMSGVGNAGSNNSGFGSGSMLAITSGSNNSGFGNTCLIACTSGSNNVAGGNAGVNIVTGSYNTCMGVGSGPTGDFSNTLALGASAAPTASNQLAIGSAAYPITTQLTVGSAGTASALPANPLGYLEMNLNGTIVVMPYYKQS